MPDPVVGAGHGGRVGTCVRGQGRREGHVVSGPPGAHDGQDGSEPGPEIGVARTGGSVVDGRVDPGVAAAMPVQQRPQRCVDSSRTLSQPAHQPDGGVKGRGARVVLSEQVGGHPGPRLLDVSQGCVGNLGNVRIRGPPGHANCRGGAQGAHQRGEPAGQPGGQQV